MTRVIGGTYGGRRLRVPPGEGTRPTSDRVREAVFGSLDATGVLNGAAVLDLYAGSGAIGLEAASRGAGFVRFVESHRRALGALHANIAALELGETTRVTAGKVATVLAAGSDTVFDVVYVDPPYALDNTALTQMLHSLVTGSWLRHDADVIVERGQRSGEVEWPEHITVGRSRRYGETVLWYGHGSWT